PPLSLLSVPTRRSSDLRLDPELLERTLPKQSAVAHAVQRDASGETQIAHPRLAVRERRHLQHHLFGDLLDRTRQIHFALRQPARSEEHTSELQSRVDLV